MDTVVDVAGGHGSLLAMILKANRKLTGVLFDLPPVIASAAKIRAARIIRGDPGLLQEAVVPVLELLALREQGVLQQAAEEL